MKTCAHCGQPFDGAATARYCSEAHRQAAYRERQRQAPTSFEEYRSAVHGDSESLPNGYGPAFWKAMLREPGTELLHVLEKEEHRALSKGTNTAGGYAVPTDFAGRVLAQLRAISPLIDALETFTTEGGADLHVPTTSAL